MSHQRWPSGQGSDSATTLRLTGQTREQRQPSRSAVGAVDLHFVREMKIASDGQLLLGPSHMALVTCALLMVVWWSGQGLVPAIRLSPSKTKSGALCHQPDTELTSRDSRRGSANCCSSHGRIQAGRVDNDQLKMKLDLSSSATPQEIIFNSHSG